MALYKVDSDTADLTKVAGGTLYADSPIGSIIPYGGTTAPSGWLFCLGHAVSRTTYADLFAVIGTAFGSGDGSTTFNIPDMRESVPKGAGETGKTVGAHVKSGGLAVGEFLDDRLQNHRHNAAYLASSGGVGEIQAGQVKGDDLYMTGYVREGRSGATTEVKSVGVNYIIKVKHTPVPADFMDSVDEAVSTALQEYPKRYVVDGYILNGDVIRGYGRATVMLYANGQAVIDYACRVTTANMGDAFGFGISPKILHQSNSNIPLITPSAGGTIMYYRTGSDSGVLYPQQDMVHFCGTHNTVQYGADMYWQFARLYAVGTAPGGWPTRQFPLNSYIQGTCYGTFTY